MGAGDRVGGCEYKEGDFVVLNKEDFRQAGMAKAYVLDVQDFVPEEAIHITYAEKPYCLEAEKKGGSEYSSFREALAMVHKAGIRMLVRAEGRRLGMFNLRGRVRVIVLNQLRYHGEPLDPLGLNLPERVTLPRNQIDLALELIDKLSGPFKPDADKDTYMDKL